MAGEVILEDFFYYDETSYSCLRRKTEWRSGCNYHIVKAYIGDATGRLDGRGYYRVTAKGVNMPAHVVVWRLHYGEIQKGLYIDHIDGDGFNNKIDNLRLVTPAHNTHNMLKRFDNTSGYTGVHKLTVRGKDLFMARCNNLDGTRHSKSFSVGKYGREEALRLAVEYRDNYLKMLNENGADYTPRHGTQRKEKQ